MFKTIAGGIFGLLLLTSGALAQSCSSYPYTLTNGTMADATQVMANFNCAALTSGATLAGTSFSGTTTFPGSTNLDPYGDFMVGKSSPSSGVIGVTLSTDGSYSFTADLAGGHYSIVNSTTGAGTYVQFRNNGTIVGSIAIGASSTAFNTTSDARLKEIDQNQRDYRDVIAHLWVGDFHWKQNGTPGFGLLAQQAYPFFPEAIAKPTTDNGVWEVDYSKFAPLSLWGVKDVYRITDEQADRISELEKRIVVLQAVNEKQHAEIQRFEVRLIALEKRINLKMAQN